MNDFLNTMPEDLKLSLANLFDRRKEPNWKTIVAKTPKDVYPFAKGEFETLRLEILKTNGSPTLKLIEKLGKKKVQICHFIDILESLEKDENINKALDLFMGEPPSIIIQPPAEAQLTVGDDVVIPCEAVGKQPMIYQWFKEKQQLKDETSKELTLTKVTPLTEGLYICRVANVRGYQFSRWVRVVVEKQQADETLNVKKINNVPPEGNRELSDGDDNGITSSDIFQPNVTVHPQSVTLSYGSLLSLSCDCNGDPNPRFQWLKDEEEIPGATSRDLVISQVSQDHQGMYTCRVSNNAVTVNSRCANVRITQGKVQTTPMRKSEESQEVSDKVALLIGNKDYDHCDKLGKLYHPTNDVSDIAGVLRSIGFKVISLVNLRLHEMRQALQLFADLLDPGVYAVFYFAGHGFETSGKSYLMPIDADDNYDCSQNLPANEVLQILQEREAKLKVLLLDCCRTTPVNQGVKDLRDPISSGGLNAEQENVVIAFGCCSQGRVFEHRLKKNGYFAMHLLEHLGREKNVEQILLDVAKGVRDEQIYDSYTGHIQMVYRHSSLAENWCLCDDIIPNEERSLQALHWQRGHELPDSPVVVYRRDDVVVTLRFDAEFSNMMLIRARIDIEDDDIIPQPVQFQIPPNKTINGIRVDEISKGDSDMPEKYTEDERIIKLSDLQRLEGQLCLNLNVNYITSDDVMIKETVQYEFEERPLYARLV